MACVFLARVLTARVFQAPFGKNHVLILRRRDSSGDARAIFLHLAACVIAFLGGNPTIVHIIRGGLGYDGLWDGNNNYKKSAVEEADRSSSACQSTINSGTKQL